MAAEKQFIYRSRIRFAQTDPAGLVFFPRYFELFQEAIEDWFDNGLGQRYADVILKQRLGLPTAHTECTFLRPTSLGDQLDLAVKPERVGNSSLTVRFEGTVDGELRLRGESVLVLIDLNSGRPVPLNDDLRLRIQPYIDKDT